MKSIRSALLPLLLLAFVGCDDGARAQSTEPSSSESGSMGTEMRRETPSQRAHRWVEEGATLVDVRTPSEFNSGHIEGAVNIPVQVIEQRVSEIPTDKKVVVYCRSGARSGAAERYLRERGYEVVNLGPMTAW